MTLFTTAARLCGACPAPRRRSPEPAIWAQPNAPPAAPSPAMVGKSGLGTVGGP